MKRRFSLMILSLILFAGLPLDARAAQLLIPVGEVIGLQLQDDRVTVAAYDELLGKCARDAGLKPGDEILSVNGRTVDSAEDVRESLTGEPIELTIRRGGKLSTLHLTPTMTEEGPRMGVYLRQGIAGIGTVTFYDPSTGLFGTLGHGVSGSGGKLLEMTRGEAFQARLESVKRGASGAPGQLRGSADGREPFAELLRNTPQGVFGITKQGWKGTAVPTASYEEVKTGEAAIRCTVNASGPQEYSVEILKIYPQTRADGRNFLLKVTDPKLLECTGGVVQGMSGSPLLQNGKIIGAVTHVLVNDPTMGYGIFIENMLEAAG